MNDSRRGPRSGKLSQRWDEMYRRLEQFHRKHGHCNVPQRFPEDKALGAWVSRKKSTRHRKLITKDQVERLNLLGFNWEIQSERFERIWNEMFERLQQFKSEEGHCNVPTVVYRDKKLG